MKGVAKCLVFSGIFQPDTPNGKQDKSQGDVITYVPRVFCPTQERDDSIAHHFS
jgi:hypothetical protein